MPGDFWGTDDDHFTGISLAELDILIQAHTEKLNQQQELLAWHAANVMQVHVKKGTKITPDKLLGRHAENSDKVVAAKAARAAKRARMEIHRDLAEELLAEEKPFDFEEDLDEWTKEVLRDLVDDHDEKSATVDGDDAEE